MKTLNKIDNKNLKGDLIMKTSKNLYQTVLTIAVVLLSVVAFGQNTSNENPFTSKKFITIRGDVNKSNPVEAVPMDLAHSGSGNQIETNYAPNRKLDNRKNGVSERPPKRQELEKTNNISFRNLYNYPNPFVDRTTLEYKVDRPVYVHLAVYKKGLLVDIVSSDFQNPGTYRATFDANGYPDGTYTAVITVGDEVMSHKMYKISMRDEIVR